MNTGQTASTDDLYTRFGVTKQEAEAVKAQFEKDFGKNAKVRNRKQWLRLVNVYGLPVVCEKEHMEAKEVILRCNETFSQRLDRQANERNK